MSNRGITNPALLAEIASKTVQYYELVAIETVQNDVTKWYYISNAPRDLVYGGNTYKSFGALLGFDTVEENSNFEIPTLKLQISGIAPIDSTSGDSFLKIMLLPSTQYIDRSVVIHRVFLQQDQYIAGSDTGFELYRGFITNAQAQHDNLGVTTVALTTSSHWTNFDRATGRRTCTASQSVLYPADLGFEYCVEVQKEIEWKE